MFIPVGVAFLIAIYVGCFKDEFDQENIKSIWVIVGIVIVLMLLGAIFTSFGSVSSYVRPI